ncbi:MAG: PatB family C-S lyase [Thiomicrospira sp.]|jgi:cystathionine beta-lyase|nr:PatB family C-S lyase [Thiomicrospira sp.]
MTTPFDTPISREHTWAEKYEARSRLFGHTDLRPMWVADMEFASPPFIIQALHQRLNHPILGYSEYPFALKQQVCDWQNRRFGWSPDPNGLYWLNGVVSGLYTSVQCLTQPNDGVIVFTPIYPPFMRAVSDQGRRLLPCPLQLDSEGYRIDWPALERLLSDATLLLLSNPHNPGGQVWSADTLMQLGERCLAHKVKLVSDEIWADLNLNPQRHPHTPLASLSTTIAQHSITLNAPSKAFNLAALQTAYALIPNAHLAQAFSQQQQRTRAAEPNLFGMIALQAAYTDQGEAWLTQQLIPYLNQLVDLAEAELTPNEALHWLRPHASYLLWLDFRQRFQNSEALEHWCYDQAKLGLSPGHHFGEAGRGFMRMNLAMPLSELQQALRQFNQAWLCDY